jgi:hypothetical protein
MGLIRWLIYSLLSVLMSAALGMIGGWMIFAWAITFFITLPILIRLVAADVAERADNE